MYSFKLQALLNHRRHQEEALQKQLAEGQRKLTDARRRLRLKKKEKQKHAQTLQQKQARGCTINECRLLAEYIQQLLSAENSSYYRFC